MEEMKETQESLQRKREQALQRLRKERTEEALWDCVTAYQDFEFHTYSGLPYSYHMKYGRSGTYTKELWINRREKSKSLSLELRPECIIRKWLELQQGERKTSCRAPESAGRYPWNHVYLRHLLRVCPAGNAGKSKRKNCSADSRTKIAGKINFSPMQVLTTTHWVI